MSRERSPECCNSEITVEHILTKCRKYEELRRKYRLPEDLKILLGPECPKDRIIGYLSESTLINEI